MATKVKIKLPKRIAGVKIPKSVRKGPIGGFLNSGAGQLLIAQALIGVAGAAALSRTDQSSRLGHAVRHPIHTSRRAGSRVARTGADQAARFSYSLKEAARAFRDAMENGPEVEHELIPNPEDPDREWDSTAQNPPTQTASPIITETPSPIIAEVSPESAAKKKSSRNDPVGPH